HVAPRWTRPPHPRPVTGSPGDGREPSRRDRAMTQDRPMSRVVVVTGGARGIGAAIAEAFAGDGAIVHLLDLDRDQAAEVAARLSGHGAEVTARQVDVSDAVSVARAIADVQAANGRIDVLCNNAGIVDGLETVE